MKSLSDARRNLQEFNVEGLRQRGRVIRATHRFFQEKGYVEIHPPILVPAPGMEPHIAAMSVSAQYSKDVFLQTSPEFALKTILGAGLDNIYALTPCFRDEPMSQTHSPQFMMLEWYRVGASLVDLMNETEELLKFIAHECHADLTPRAVELMSRTFDRMTVREVFIREGKIDPWQYLSAADFRAAAREKGHTLSAQSTTWDEIFFDIFMNTIEPTLDGDAPLFLWGWPASQAALARLDPDDASRALRFELYAGGYELANAFDELVDAKEQRERFQKEQADRRDAGAPVYPIDERLLSAIERMKPTAGIALGFDRLVMLLTGRHHIEEVLSW